MEVKMDEKEVKLMNNATRYFGELTNEFLTTENYVMTHRGRHIYMSEHTIKKLKYINKTPVEHFTHIVNCDLTIAILEWFKTRAAYDATLKDPAVNIINWFVWRELGTVNMYLINRKDSFYDIVPNHLRDAVTAWSKKAGCFIDATEYPKIKCHFSQSQEEVGIDYLFTPNGLAEKFVSVIGDFYLSKKRECPIEYKTYNHTEHGTFNSITLINDTAKT